MYMHHNKKKAKNFCSYTQEEPATVPGVLI